MRIKKKGGEKSFGVENGLNYSLLLGGNYVSREERGGAVASRISGGGGGKR